jgi:hypothetical protein
MPHSAVADGHLDPIEKFAVLPFRLFATSFPTCKRHVGDEIAGRTLGLLGLGNIGREVARIGKAFGMTLIAWSQNLTDEQAADAGAVKVPKDDLFRRRYREYPPGSEWPHPWARRHGGVCAHEADSPAREHVAWTDRCRLIASQNNREFREQQNLLTQAAKRSDDLSQVLYQNGGASYLQVLTNETNYF